MKFPLALAAIILAVGAGLGWHGQQQIVAARQTHGQLVAAATLLGIPIDPAHPGKPLHSARRERDQHAPDAKLVAAEFIAFAKEMAAAEKSGASQPDAAMQQRMMDMMERLLALDVAQLKILIAEVRADTGLDDEIRQGLLGFSIRALATDHPQAALALFTGASDLFKEGGTGGHVISSALTRWAKDDPMAALKWVRENAEQHPDLVTENVKRGLLSGAATQDPHLAFRLISELGCKDANNAIAGIVEAARTPEQRSVTLAALRGYLATLTDEAARNEAATWAATALANGVAREGFEAASKWLAAAALTPAELAGFASGLHNFSIQRGETGQWIEWLGAALPADKVDDSIRDLVINWTRNDYQAAGQWLSSTPEGPARNISIRHYAETVSRYEPEVAAQWALTLPAGNARDDTLRQIYQNWPKNDAAAAEAAAAFANQHGIK
ncbi:MAG: hypothetical protein NTW21_32370 [Verrucomicrobia bacterium]|nr:hypothetical protein [Verrucomicrobiota bacterium]